MDFAPSWLLLPRGLSPFEQWRLARFWCFKGWTRSCLFLLHSGKHRSSEADFKRHFRWRGVLWGGEVRRKRKGVCTFKTDTFREGSFSYYSCSSWQRHCSAPAGVNFIASHFPKQGTKIGNKVSFYPQKNKNKFFMLKLSCFYRVKKIPAEFHLTVLETAEF